MKQGIQRVGRFLSGMVMPNIGAFIAWGLITALFIPDGWLPNVEFAKLVGPMLTYLLPILIGYSGGWMISGQRGAVVGSIATLGVVVGADIPMFLGAMIVGPLGGLCIKKFDTAMSDRIPVGFEMLVNNFSAGIVGMLLALIAALGINPLCVGLVSMLSAGVRFFVEHGLLPLTAIFVEPGKILFLNNAINHGIFSPLGIEQVSAAGKSIFFMIESNPGPGLGLLLAYCLVGKGNAKSTAPGAAIIHFLGGIHEIYFPYVLMNPILVVAMIAGGASGIFTLQLMDGGLVAAASPGSICVTLMTALASLILGKSVDAKLSMTGEITLSGQVLPVGGIKEKVMAAQRSGIERIILPKENEQDLEDVPKEVTDQLQFYFAETIDDVLKIALDIELPTYAIRFDHALNGAKDAESDLSVIL